MMVIIIIIDVTVNKSHEAHCHCSLDLASGGLVIYLFLVFLKEKARRAMDYLWQQRHRGSDLMGTIINVHSGDWIRRGQWLLVYGEPSVVSLGKCRF